jgi:Tfp pilus assembly protein PilX
MFFVLAILVVGVLFVAGAIHIQQGSNNTVEITVDKQRAEQTAETLLQEGEQALGQAEQAARNNQQFPQQFPQQQNGMYSR